MITSFSDIEREANDIDKQSLNKMLQKHCNEDYELMTNLPELEKQLKRETVFDSNELAGTYDVLGHNANEMKTNYSGQLKIDLIETNTYKVIWVIGNNVQIGYGTLKNNIFYVDFWYLDEEKIGCCGTVIYHFSKQGALNGYWVEEYADDHFNGCEICMKLDCQNQKILTKDYLQNSLIPESVN